MPPNAIAPPGGPERRKAGNATSARPWLLHHLRGQRVLGRPEHQAQQLRRNGGHVLQGHLGYHLAGGKAGAVANEAGLNPGIDGEEAVGTAVAGAHRAPSRAALMTTPSAGANAACGSAPT